MSVRTFDLNVEDVLDNWEVEHAIREIIANALDEQVITRTPDISITKDGSGDWHIRDYGRGLRIQHFTLNESQEKLLSDSEIIGKFGVGLKDALATFYRRGIDVFIRASSGCYRLKRVHKHGFEDILTLHVEYDDTPSIINGTEFILSRVADAQMESAKSLFLRFNGEEILETNNYGQIIKRQGDTARVYIMGVLANDEPNFLFSYNIISLTSSMKKKLNRERLNVGRSTYAERVKTILKNAISPLVTNLLVSEISKRATGNQCDEMSWVEISQIALNLLHEQQRVVFLTEQQLTSRPELLDLTNRDGLKPVIVTEQQKERLDKQAEDGGQEVRTLDKFLDEYNESFQYTFVDPDDLTPDEYHVYGLTSQILDLVGELSIHLPSIGGIDSIGVMLKYSTAEKPHTLTFPIKEFVLISETMRITPNDLVGYWDPSKMAIIIKRSQLHSLASYARTLLHEIAHVSSGKTDATREFENQLSHYLGLIATKALCQ